ncbi:restriction endonuclease subunit S [Catenovulum adriaticum]|uniref:Restriction endonuclease subunit S n=1 Tax=Catenovulum adriaticum TaxID=2984846 RepID=A0ABY7AKJ8_9ALTE|nr:restriction endonuclease subunit S [Catenovulum sp. TS8]WAJ69758.1 restriction endonuclease subunit S [Catenovulum sp. TS8]
MTGTKTSNTNADQLITEHLDIWTIAIEQKSSSGRGSSKKFSLHGIKKLRELILELAVRGKLVPQDPNDEPASVLLERIGAEKAQLIKDKKIKKPKVLPEISEDEKPFEISEGWEWVRLGELGNTQTGGTPSKNKPELFGSDVPFIKPGDILEGKVCYKNEGLSLLGAKSLGRIAPANSLLMVCIGTIGKCSYIDRDCAFNQQINSITPYVNIIKYLHKVTSTAYFQNLAWELSSSTTIAIINKGRWESIPVALAPIAEQERIVAKVDELMALCDQLEQQTEQSLTAHQTLVEELLKALTDSKDAGDLTAMDGGNEGIAGANSFQASWQRIAEHFDILFTTEQSIEQLKQTILQLAVMGKLVPQNPSDEPASVLLEKIAKEKAQLIKDKKIKKQKPLPAITDEEKPFELPSGWDWSRLQDITLLITDGKHGDCNNLDNSGFYFLSAKDIQNGKLVYEHGRQIVPSEFAEVHQRTNLECGDICMVNTGATVGKMALVEDNQFTRQTTFQKSVAVIKVAKTYVHNEFIALFLQSETPNLLKKSGGSAINNLLLGDLKKKVTQLPPLPEQHRIVAKVDELMALCDQLKARLTDAQTTKLHLTDAIVEQAL